MPVSPPAGSVATARAGGPLIGQRVAELCRESWEHTPTARRRRAPEHGGSGGNAATPAYRRARRRSITPVWP